MHIGLPDQCWFVLQIWHAAALGPCVSFARYAGIRYAYTCPMVGESISLWSKSIRESR